MTSDPWVELGYAIRQARLGLGWSTRDLAREALGNDARNGYVGQVEKGKLNLSPETIDKFDQALELPADVVKAAQLAPPPSQEKVAEEEKRDVDTERLLTRVAKDETAPNVAEALLTTLAYEFAGSKFTDLETTYIGLRKALEAAENIRKRGEMPPDNTGSQLNAVMKEVAALNERGELDQADALLEDEEKRMFEAHKAEKERLEEQARRLLERRLDQDRLRNDPAAAADRLVKDLKRQFPLKRMNLAVLESSIAWREQGRAQGDPFELTVALELANHALKYAGDKQNGMTLLVLSFARFFWGQRMPGLEMLRGAAEAADAALESFSRDEEPEKWGSAQIALGHALKEMGERQQDSILLRQACEAYCQDLEVSPREEAAKFWADANYNLGVGLLALGELEQSIDLLEEAKKANLSSLEIWDSTTSSEDWALSQNSLGNCRLMLGRLSGSSKELDLAQQNFDNCLGVWTKGRSPFRWAIAQWNLGDLALARFELKTDTALLKVAEKHVLAAREVFEIGSEYQTGRCDDLLEKIVAARSQGGAAG